MNNCTASRRPPLGAVPSAANVGGGAPSVENSLRRGRRYYPDPLVGLKLAIK